MIRVLPDPLTLDEMIIGVEEDPEVWADLALSPGAEAAWSCAVERRRRVDRIARLVCGHKWLAAPLLKVLRFRAKIRDKSTSDGVALVFGVVPALAQALAEPSHQTVQMEWGRSETVSVPTGTTVTVVVRSGSPRCEVFFRYQKGEGPLPSRSWKMEHGDSPVLLVACVGGPGGNDLEAELAAAENSAAVILMELDGVVGAPLRSE